MDIIEKGIVLTFPTENEVYFKCQIPSQQVVLF